MLDCVYSTGIPYSFFPFPCTTGTLTVVPGGKKEQGWLDWVIQNDKGTVIHSLVTFLQEGRRHFSQRTYLEIGETKY